MFKTSVAKLSNINKDFVFDACKLVMIITLCYNLYTKN